MAEPRHRGWLSPGVPRLLPLSPGQFGGFSALPKLPAAAPVVGLPCSLPQPPISPPGPAHPPTSPGGCSIPFIWGKPPPPGPVSRVLPQLSPPPRRPPDPLPHSSTQRLRGHRGPMAPVAPRPPARRGGTWDTHRQGLRDRASRPALLGDGGGFHQLPLLPGEHGSRGRPSPGARWPLARCGRGAWLPRSSPRRPHSPGRTVRRARVTPPYFLIGFAGEPETGKAKRAPGARGRGGRGTPAAPGGVLGPSLAPQRAQRGRRRSRDGGLPAAICVGGGFGDTPQGCTEGSGGHRSGADPHGTLWVLPQFGGVRQSREDEPHPTGHCCRPWVGG